MEIGAETSYESSQDGESAPMERSPTGWHQYWSKEMEAAHKRLKSYIKRGNTIVNRYLDERQGGDDFRGGEIPYRLNLFHANVSTVLSMLYGRTPKIDVSREHHDPDDDTARVASLLLERILAVDSNPSSDEFSVAVRGALQDRLLPGMGIARVRYEYEVEVVSEEVIDGISGTITVSEYEKLLDEQAPIDYVHWQDVRWGWCRTWREMPWLAYRSWMDKEKVTERFGATIANQITYKTQTPAGDGETNDVTDSKQKNNVQQAEIWEIWCKKDRKVYWWSEGAPAILDVEEDPLGLKNFWPSPQPMVANLTTSNFLPTADFTIAQDLYNEIDTLQTRISMITRAVKVVGVYDKNSEGVQRMLEEGMENQLIPVDNWAMFSEKGGVKGQVDWFPAQDIVGVLSTLQGIRDQTIDLLYQVTGMSDILRGQSSQYSGVGQDILKAKFASVRVQSLQDDFARFASELEGLKAEVITNLFSRVTIEKHSNAQFVPEFDKNLVPAAIDLIKSPEVHWRINIKPESIAMVDYAQIKAERTEFLTSMATFVQSAGSMVQSVPQAMPILLEMLKWTMSGYKGADYLEGMLDQAIEMASNMPDQGQQQQQAEQQRQQAQQQADMDKIQAKAQADLQVINAKGQMELQHLMAEHQAKMEQQMAKSQADLQKIAKDLKADLQVITTKLSADMQMERSQAMNAAAELEVESENAMTEMQVQHELSLEAMGAESELALEEMGANAALEARRQNREANTD